MTECNDVVLKLGTFERDFRFISQKQLQSEVQSHYIAQVMKQIYMLVFGLDILGNPFGLVRGISDGVKDLFYEPYLGAVEGPEEFMVGLSSGVRNFVGSTVGGTMGAGTAEGSFWGRKFGEKLKSSGKKSSRKFWFQSFFCHKNISGRVKNTQWVV